MWQLVLNRAMVMFAQATTGTPVAPATPAATGQPVNVTPMMNNPSVKVQGDYRHTPWHTILLVVYFLVCLGLVIAVLLQTTKSEGLSGIMGGSHQSVFKGKKGFEETLQEATNYLAVSFIVMSFLVSLFAFRSR